MTFLRPLDLFDPGDRRFYVLGVKTCADIPVSTGGTSHDPWQIAGETPDAPDGTNDETGSSDYADATALEPGHCWPFMGWGATVKANAGGYYPACQDNHDINHYRRFVRLAPRMFGSDGRILQIRSCGVLKATNAANVIDIILHHDLVTATPTTTLTAGKYTGFRFPLGNLGANEVAWYCELLGQPMGPYKSVWSAKLTVAAQTNPQTTAPALTLERGPVMMDLAGTGPNMDTTGSLLALLFSARRSTAITYDQLGTAGGAAQDGSEVYMKGGACVALLWPGK